MIGAAKGDIVFESLELLAEFLLRLFGKALHRTFPSGSMENWGWAQWLWVAFLLAVASWTIWFVLMRARHKPS